MPSITNWSRLEPRVRNDNLDRSLQAQVRDPLWMLTRQWQFGEFLGEDAGSIVSSQITLVHQFLTHYRDDQGTWAPLDSNVPLETGVEREPVPMDLRTRVQAGLHFARLLTRAEVADTITTFLDEVPIEAEDNLDGSVIDEATSRFLDGVAGRVIDGGAILEAVANGENLGALFADHNVAMAVQGAAQALLDWFNLTYSQNLGRGEGAWSPPHLEYRFSVSAGDPNDGGMVLKASEYSGGHLDWYAFDFEGDLPANDNEGQTFHLMPSPVTFRGMPGSRWWEFEEGQTDFGQIDTHTTDLGRLLLAEFGLIYGDDWFIIPYDAPVGAVVRVSSLIVTDVFGLHFLINLATPGLGQATQRSRMFSLSSTQPGASSDMFLFLPPSLGLIAEGPPLEEVIFMRDEMANMAWGIEKTLASALGEPIAGFDAYQQSVREAAAESSEIEGNGDDEVQIAYQFATLVAENWIPFVPVRPDPVSPNIQLEKAALLREIEESQPQEIPARGRILNPNLEPYRVFDEEIPRASRRVFRRFQRTRWIDGSTHLWIGRQKKAGHGEGSSGLRFDILKP